MIISRSLRGEDLVSINRIFEKQPELGVPSLQNLVVNGVIENTDNNQIIAYGAVKLFGEAVLILDKDISKKHKAKAIREVMRIAISFSRNRNLEYLYLISNSDSFTKVLSKNYGFKVCPGELLLLDLEGESNG
jgi:hypothetical protein